MPRAARPIEEWLKQPVIPVFWDVDPAEEPWLKNASIAFLQGGELVELPRRLAKLRAGALGRTPLMLHIDLLGGLTSDEAGLRYLAELGLVDGIITVRGHLVTAARKLGLASILLLFLQDGRSVDRGLHVIEQSKPDAVELVPGVAALETADQFRSVRVPRIAGGLIRTPELVRRLLDNGCKCASSSDAALWRMNRK
jgi:glycerol uptake operon antiterminator